MAKYACWKAGLARLLRNQRRMIKAAMMKGILGVAIPVSLLATAVSLFVLVGFPGTPGDSMPPDMGWHRKPTTRTPREKLLVLSGTRSPFLTILLE